MSILETTAASVAHEAATDADAIARLGQAFAAQLAAFAADRKPSLDQRRERLGALMEIGRASCRERVYSSV